MNTPLPYTPAELTRLIAEAKYRIDHGETDMLATICHDLLPWAGREEVDATLGQLLKLLMRYGSPIQVSEIETEAFLLARLRLGWNPAGASLAYVSWKYRHTFQSGVDPDIAQVQDLAVTAESLWPYLDEPTRLAHGLYAKLATIYSTLDNPRALSALGKELLEGPVNDERQYKDLLRIIKHLQRLQAAPELACLLEQLLAQSRQHPAWMDAALTSIEALRVSSQRLSDYQRLSLLIRQCLPYLKAAESGLDDKRLVTALLRCAEFDLLHELLPVLASKLDDEIARATLILVLEQLFQYDVLGEGEAHIEQAYRQDAGDPMAALLLARLCSQQGRSSAEIAPVFQLIRTDKQKYDEAVLWLARLYDSTGEYEQLIRWLNSHRLPEHKEWLQLRDQVQAVTGSCSLPKSASEKDGDRLHPQALGSLASLLMPLVQELNGDLSHSASVPICDLRHRLDDLLQDVDKATEEPSDFPPFECLRAARELMRAAKVHCRDMVVQYRTTPTAVGIQYGVLDATRIIALFETLHRVTMKLSRHGIDAALHDAPLSDVRHLCQLVDIHRQSAFELGEMQSIECLLHTLRNRQVAPAVMVRLLERCALQRGDLDEVTNWVQAQGFSKSEIHRLEASPAWARIEAMERDILVDQKPEKGMFEYRDSCGALHTAQHEVPATQVDRLRVSGLRVRDTELLIGPYGSILRPHPWHYRDVYGYPRPSPIRLNYGHCGCRLKPARETVHVREPVVVLANMDGPYYRNYYHWMLLILTRVAGLLDRGLLEERKVLMPAELSTWMTTSLELTGLTENRMVRYTAEQKVLVDEAWVIGSVESAAAALIKPLQQRLWAAADVEPHTRASTRAVWLSRRKQPWRSLANVEAVEAMAKRFGFEVIAPESLNLLDQVRLCAGAAVIAGPGGANLTNVIFARPGTRILGLVSESNNYPGFIDLCTILDLPQRWLFGRADPRKGRGGPMHESFEVEMTVLEQEFQRLLLPE